MRFRAAPAITAATVMALVVLATVPAAPVPAREPVLAAPAGAAMPTIRSRPAAATYASAPGGPVAASVPALPTNCPAATFPPGAPYGIQFSGVLTSSVTISKTPLGFPLTVPSVTASFCGLLQLGFDAATNTPTEIGTVSPANLVFGPATANVGLGQIPTIVLTTAPSTTSTPSVVSPTDGRLNLALSGAVATQSSLLGINCQIGPIALTLTTTGSGGSPVSGPLAGASATLVAQGFTVPLVSSTGASGTCPGFLAGQINGLVGLPNPSTSLTANVKLHLCNNPVPVCSLPAV